MRPARTTFIATLLLIGNSLSSAVAGAIQPLDHISDQVKLFIEQTLASTPGRHEVVPSNLDPRLRLPKCTTPLQTQFLSTQRTSGNMTVSVSCRTGKPWTIHVPVAVKSFVDVAIIARPISRNVPIRETDLRFEEREISLLSSGYYTSIQPLLGKVAKRPLINGTVVSPNDLDAQKIIRRGNRVTIIAEGDSFSVRMEGIAQRDAAEGEQIPVENLSSQRRVDAIAIASGMVKIPL